MDYIIIGFFMISTMFVVSISKKISKSSNLVIIGLVLHSIGNIMLGNFSSLSSIGVKSSNSFSFSLFNLDMSLKSTTIPLMLFITGGIISLSYGVKLISSVQEFSAKNIMDKVKIIHISTIFALSLYIFIRSFDGEYVYNLFLVSPITSILGIYALNYLKSFEKSNENNQDIKRPDEVIINPAKKMIKTNKVITLLNSLMIGVVNFILIVIVSLLNGLSGLSLFNQEKIYNIHSYLVLSQITSAILLLIILLVITIQKVREFKLIAVIFQNISACLIIACIVLYIQCIAAFNPEIVKNINIQIILSGVVFGLIIISFLNHSLLKSRNPSMFIGIFSLIFINSAYITKIPTKVGEMWSEWSIYSNILIGILVLLSIISVYSFISYFKEIKKIKGIERIEMIEEMEEIKEIEEIKISEVKK